MRNLSEKKLPILRKCAAKVKPWSSRLGQAEEELSPFFALSLDLLCIAGVDGYFKRMNRAWESSLGWTQEELRVRPFLDFVRAEDRALQVFGLLGQGRSTRQTAHVLHLSVKTIESHREHLK